jgi:hypothetical protein
MQSNVWSAELLDRRALTGKGDQRERDDHRTGGRAEEGPAGSHRRDGETRGMRAVFRSSVVLKKNTTVEATAREFHFTMDEPSD